MRTREEAGREGGGRVGYTSKVLYGVTSKTNGTKREGRARRKGGRRRRCFFDTADELYATAPPKILLS